MTMASNSDDFARNFEKLTGHTPFPWQSALWRRLLEGDWPEAVDIPTGLGKTSIIAVWLLAWKARPDDIPRRLVYVVNRRTVVDQTTTEVERLREHISKVSLPSLGISTLRGQFADNREWSADPSQPAVICGTVDMIGSRLLFSGYGVGFKGRPLHAGFLGQDVLLVHDEAHLEPAFQNLVETIRDEQVRCGEFGRFHAVALTATARSGNGDSKSMFSFTGEDQNHPIVKQRIDSRKELRLTTVEDEKQVATKVAEIAEGYEDLNAAVAVFVRTLEAVESIAKSLKKTNRTVILLTGTMRGKERDELVEMPAFKRFLKTSEPGETVYLVCTSAGEVGVDISADHMVCDLSTFESMAQRFGRVNRYGELTDTRIDVVYPEILDEKHALTPARKATLTLLEKLNGNASPRALGSLDPNERRAAFSPEPVIPAATDILFDAWSLTSIRGKMSGRPAVEPYLRGIRDWEPPETHVAWRKEVKEITGEHLERHRPEDLLEDYPLKPHELLRDLSDRVFKHLEQLAKRHGGQPVWLLGAHGTIEVMTMETLTDKRGKVGIQGCTVILPPSLGGLSDGMLDGRSEQANDVADAPGVRIRVWSDDPDYSNKVSGMRRVRFIEFQSAEDDDAEPRNWDWFEAFPAGGGRTAEKPVELHTHVDDVVGHLKRFLENLSLAPEIEDALMLAARLHDEGKRRERFQITLGNREYPEILLAKSGRKGARVPEPFRHEFASVLDAQGDPDSEGLSDDLKDLVLHLIAAHHGRARPHFDPDEAFDPERSSAEAEELAMKTPRRFARLQRRYGRWGLAYIESLLRAADWAASAEPSVSVNEKAVSP